MDLASRIRAILAEHGHVTLDNLDDVVRRIMLTIAEDHEPTHRALFTA